MLRLSLLVTLAAGAALMIARGEPRQPPPIKIGSYLSMTGAASFLGDPEAKTLRHYIEKANAAGGLLGRRIELIVYDDGGDSDRARTFAKRLIEQDKVDAIIGGTLTATTMAAVPLIERARVPFMSLAGAVVVIEPVKRWVFKTSHTDRMACERIFVDMKKRRITAVGIIAGSGGFEKSMRIECVKVAPRYGIRIVADESYGAQETDMTAQLTKIRGAAGLGAVLNTGFGQTAAVVTKNVRQMGFKVPFYESHGVASAEYIKLAGGAAEGVRLPAAALLIAESLSDSDPQKAVAVGYKREYETRFKSDVSTFGGHAYDALQILVGAIKRTGSADKAKVRDAIEATRGYVGTAGVVNMSPRDHLGLDLSAFRMLEIRRGRWTLID